MNLTGALAAVVLTITTQNVRVSLPPPLAHHDITQAAQHSSVLFTQEMGLRDARRFAPPGWGTAHAQGLRQGDCATYYDRDLWRKTGSRAVLLTHAPFRAGTRYALVTHLRGQGTTLDVVCVHMITKSLARRAVYHRGMDRLRALLSRLTAAHVVVGGDWNRNWSQRAPLSGYHTRKPPAPTGSHGGRIDYLWWRGAAERTIRVIGHTASDHQGVRVRLRLR